MSDRHSSLPEIGNTIRFFVSPGLRQSMNGDMFILHLRFLSGTQRGGGRRTSCVSHVAFTPDISTSDQSPPVLTWTSVKHYHWLPSSFKAACPSVDRSPVCFTLAPMHPSAPGLALVALVSLSLVLGVHAQTYSATYNPNNLPDQTETGQTGTNKCGTGSSQNSTCQNVYSAPIDSHTPAPTIPLTLYGSQ